MLGSSHYKRLLLLPAVVIGLLASGCASTGNPRGLLPQCCVVYYLDGAGGGGVLANWGRGVEQGLRGAGYHGEFVNYPWQTGLGAPADQDASVEYKRAKAAGLARLIADRINRDPQVVVSVIALSAGTAVAVYALEALPQSCQVEDVFLLGASISAHYDLTRALRRVRDHVFVFTSENDAVLRLLVPLAGTADRQFCGLCAAGLYGFHMPRNAGEETKRLYSKVENISRRPGFEGDGDSGGHTDQVRAPFVQNRIAPLLMHEGPRASVVAASVVERRGLLAVATRPARP